MTYSNQVFFFLSWFFSRGHTLTFLYPWKYALFFEMFDFSLKISTFLENFWFLLDVFLPQFCAHPKSMQWFLKYFFLIYVTIPLFSWIYCWILCLLSKIWINFYPKILRLLPVFVFVRSQSAYIGDFEM